MQRQLSLVGAIIYLRGNLLIYTEMSPSSTYGVFYISYLEYFILFILSKTVFYYVNNMPVKIY